MKIYRNINEFISHQPLSIALGSFDGVHIAHRKVIEAASKYERAVFTFDSSYKSASRLMSQNAKMQIIENMGIKHYICPEFDDVKNFSAEDFCTILKQKFNAQQVVCGYNFRFGSGGRGNTELLCHMGNKLGFEVTVIDEIKYSGIDVSSSNIRSLIQNGRIKTANQLLGNPYSFALTVENGNHYGRSWGFPTINQIWDEDFTVPAFGVYASKTLINGKNYKSISNIGVRPTVGTDHILCETNIFGFSGDLYGREITVSLYDYIRPERKFCNFEALKAEVLRNIETVKGMDY